jgi:lysozyme
MDDAVTQAVALLKVDEGYRAQPYSDTKGNATVGYGWNIKEGLSKPVALGLLQLQVQEIQAQLAVYYWWTPLDSARQSVLLDMAFNEGVNGLLHYVKMLAAVSNQDWQTASAELLDSDAARELVDRYTRLAQIMLLGAPQVAA